MTEKEKKENPFAWNETIQKLLKDNGPSLVETSEPVTGCECCAGDEALYWKDNENNAFVDSKGEIMVTVKDHEMRFRVKCCPNCGRVFEQ